MEREEFKNKLEEQFLYLHLRIERLEKSIPHTAGSLVWKGDRKQYAYWQFYQNKVKVQKSVAKDQIEATKRQIEILRHQQVLRILLFPIPFTDLPDISPLGGAMLFTSPVVPPICIKNTDSYSI